MFFLSDCLHLDEVKPDDDISHLDFFSRSADLLTGIFSRPRPPENVD